MFGFHGLLADRSCGYVDVAARFIVPPVYGNVEPFTGGIARVWDAERRAFGLIRRDNTLVRGFEFEEDCAADSAREVDRVHLGRPGDAHQSLDIPRSRHQTSAFQSSRRRPKSQLGRID